MLISIALSHILVHLLKPNCDPSFSIWLQISLYWRTIVLKYLHVHGYYRVNKLMYNSRLLHLNPACSLPLTELLSRSWGQSQTHRHCNKCTDLEYTLCGIFYTRQKTSSDKINWMKPTFLFLKVLKKLSVWCRGAHFATAKEKTNLKKLQRGTLRAEIAGFKLKGTERLFQVCLKGKEAGEATMKS